MIRLVLVVVVSIALGLGFASYLHQKQFSTPEQFGPFGAQELAKASEIKDFLRAKAPEKGQPRLEVVGSKDFNFGTMRRGGHGEHDFVVRNSGDAPVEMTVFSSTCKCTVGNLEKNVLQPGEETVVKLGWELKNQTVAFAQSATLRTTDPNQRELTFTITGSVVEDALFEPGSWSLNDMEANKPYELTSTIYLYTEKPFHVVEAGWTRPQIGDFSEHEFVERAIDKENEPAHVTANRAIDIKVKLKPGMRQGPINELFRIRYYIDDVAPPADELRITELSFYGKIVGNVSMVGGPNLNTSNETYRLQMGETTVGKELTAKVFLVIRGENFKDAVPTIAETKPDGFIEASFGQPLVREKSVLFPLEVKVPATAGAGERSGRDRDDYATVQINFNREDWAPFKLFINFRVVESARSSDTQ